MYQNRPRRFRRRSNGRNHQQRDNAVTQGRLRTLSENYFQHADHFMRVIENKNINQKQNKVQVDTKLVVSDKHLAENSGVNQDKTIEEKEEKKE